MICPRSQPWKTQKELETSWLLFYAKSRGERIRSSLIFFCIVIPLHLSPAPVLLLKIYAKMEFGSYKAKQVSIILFRTAVTAVYISAYLISVLQDCD